MNKNGHGIRAIDVKGDGTETNPTSTLSAPVIFH